MQQLWRLRPQIAIWGVCVVIKGQSTFAELRTGLDCKYLGNRFADPAASAGHLMRMYLFFQFSRYIIHIQTTAQPTVIHVIDVSHIHSHHQLPVSRATCRQKKFPTS